MLSAAFDKGRAAARAALKVGASLPTAQLVAPGSGVRGAAAPIGPSLGNLLRPLKGPLGLAALGAGGAMLAGMHRHRPHDDPAHDLVYAPMIGGY